MYIYIYLAIPGPNGSGHVSKSNVWAHLNPLPSSRLAPNPRGGFSPCRRSLQSSLCCADVGARILKGRASAKDCGFPMQYGWWKKSSSAPLRVFNAAISTASRMFLSLAVQYDASWAIYCHQAVNKHVQICIHQPTTYLAWV